MLFVCCLLTILYITTNFITMRRFRAIQKAVAILLVLTLAGLGLDYGLDSDPFPNTYTLVPLLILIVLCLAWLVMYVFDLFTKNSDR